MTDLSKELGEIKRRHAETPIHSSYKPTMQSDLDRARLLSIIETEIPGMLRADALKLRKSASMTSGSTVAKLRFAGEQLEAQATLIESLTKNEKE